MINDLLDLRIKMSFNLLPPEVILNDISYCDTKTFITLRHTNKFLYDLITSKVMLKRIIRLNQEIMDLELRTTYWKCRYYKEKVSRALDEIEYVHTSDENDWSYVEESDYDNTETDQDHQDDEDEESTSNNNPRYVMNILYNDQGLYLSQRTNKHKEMYGLWQAPGGKVDEIETSIDAVLRET